MANKAGITWSSFAPGASSRPIIRGLDVNRVCIVENGVGGTGASDLGEDHFVPIDPLTSNQIEVIRGPATLRYGSQSIGGVVSATNNRIPEALPCGDSLRPLPFPTKGPALGTSDRGCATGELRGAFTSVNNGLDGAVLFDGGYGNWAVHADAFGRKTDDYRVPHYPYLVPPNPAVNPNATQPGTFNGRQPNSAMRADGQSAGASYVFNATQVDGYTPKLDEETPIEQRIESAEQFFSRINALVLHQGNRAFYSPADDTITLPPFAAFFTPTDYYSTRAHETGHWTAKVGRCDRQLGKRFGDNAYSVEELIAELTAAFTLAHLGLSSEPRPDHAQYIQSWLRVLKADKRAIFTAASKAQQAADYLVRQSEQSNGVAEVAA